MSGGPAGGGAWVWSGLVSTIGFFSTYPIAAWFWVWKWFTGSGFCESPSNIKPAARHWSGVRVTRTGSRLSPTFTKTVVLDGWCNPAAHLANEPGVEPFSKSTVVNRFNASSVDELAGFSPVPELVDPSAVSGLLASGKGSATTGGAGWGASSVGLVAAWDKSWVLTFLNFAQKLLRAAMVSSEGISSSASVLTAA